VAIYVNDKHVVFGAYPNGEAVVPKLDVKPPFTVRLHWENDDDLVRLLLVRGLLGQMWLEANKPGHFPRLFIDYMPYSRMDRSENGSCFSLQHVTRFIRELNWQTIDVVEPHSDATLALLGDDAHVQNITTKLLPKIMADVGFEKSDDFLVLPDNGAYQRYWEQAANVIGDCHTVVMGKKRDFDTGEIQGLEVDYQMIRGWRAGSARGMVDRKALIFDDLSSRGGTFVAAASVLREQLDFAEVYLLVTHMETVGYTGSLGNSDLITRVFCTDSMTPPPPEQVPDNFTIITREEWAP
jgi:ribose-phosphate pyrophosphokinase